MADKTMPTPGPWTAHSAKANDGWDVSGPNDEGVAHTGIWKGNARHEMVANARLIATAGTAAHEVAQMGYDPVEAVRMLPEMLRTLSESTEYEAENYEPDEAWWMRHARRALARAAGKEGDDGR